MKEDVRLINGILHYAKEVYKEQGDTSFVVIWEMIVKNEKELENRKSKYELFKKARAVLEHENE
jgi:hypothetical protein